MSAPAPFPAPSSSSPSSLAELTLQEMIEQLRLENEKLRLQSEKDKQEKEFEQLRLQIEKNKLEKEQLRLQIEKLRLQSEKDQMEIQLLKSNAQLAEKAMKLVEMGKKLENKMSNEMQQILALMIARESHYVIVREWNSNHLTSHDTAAGISATPQPITLRVTSYQDLIDKVTVTFFHSTPGASNTFFLYYLTDGSRWWESRVKVDSEDSFDMYVSCPFYQRPKLLLWYPPSDCLDASHEKLAAEEHHHSPLKESIPPCALHSVLPPPVVATVAPLSPSISSGSSRSGSSVQQADFAEAVRRRDDDLCVVCEAPHVDVAHIVPVKSERTAADQVKAKLLTLYDPRNGLTLCTLCHDTFDAGLWYISPKDRATIIVSDALLENQAGWKDREGQQVRRPSHHQDCWPSADTLRVQHDFFNACKIERENTK